MGQRTQSRLWILWPTRLGFPAGERASENPSSQSRGLNGILSPTSHFRRPVGGGWTSLGSMAPPGGRGFLVCGPTTNGQKPHAQHKRVGSPVATSKPPKTTSLSSRSAPPCGRFRFWVWVCWSRLVAAAKLGITAASGSCVDDRPPEGSRAAGAHGGWS